MSYELCRTLSEPDEFVALREAAGMTPRTREAAERGLPNSCYGGSVFQRSDIVVHPDHVGRGLGREITQVVVDWLYENAPSPAYVNLMADVDGFYGRFGFEPTAPASKGTSLRIA
jgi:GNAT superfamily N-acetyltransferase